VGFVVEDLLASKIFTALVDASPTSSSISSTSSSSSSSSLFDALRDIISARNLSPLCRALSPAILCPSSHASSSVSSARIAGEITALHVARLLHLLQSQESSSRSDEFEAALEECVAMGEGGDGGSCVAAACVNQLLFIVCMQAHAMIGEGRLGAATNAISGAELYYHISVFTYCIAHWASHT